MGKLLLGAVISAAASMPVMVSGSPTPDFYDGKTSWNFNGNGVGVFHNVENANTVIADFNGDGLMDLYNSGSGYVDFYNQVWPWQLQSNMYYQNADGTFSRDAIEQYQKDDSSYAFAQPRHDIAPLMYPHFATLDYNNDGLVDLLVCGVLNGDDVTWHKDRIPCRALTSTVNSDSKQLWMVTLLYKNEGNGSFAYLENTGLPVIYVDHASGDLHKGHSPLKTPFAVGDYDRDGYADIAVMGKEVVESNGAENDLVALYHNNGDGTFSRMDIVDGNRPFHAVRQGNVNFADVNNDGWLDLLFDGWFDSYDIDGLTGGSGCRVYINNEGKSFTDITASLSTVSASRGAGTAVADVDKDGYLDVVNIGYCDNFGWGSFCFRNTTGGGSLDFERINLGEKGLGMTEHLNIYARDFDGDGNIDIIFDGQDENHIYYGNADGTYERKEQLPVRTNRTHNGSMAVGDINGNGLADRFETGYMWVHDDYRQPLGYNDWSLTATLWENRQESAQAPLAPEVTMAGWIDGKLVAKWKDIDDMTVAYNVVFKTPDGKIISNIPVNSDGKLLVSDGKHTLVRPGVGEYSVSHSEIIAPSLRGGASRVAAMPGYSVGVQAVSLYNETASPIAWAMDVTGIDENLVADNMTVKTEGGNIIVNAADGIAVSVADMLGRTVAAGRTNEAIAVAAKGVLIVTAGDKTFKIVK